MLVTPYVASWRVYYKVTLSEGLSKTDVEPSEISHINGAKEELAEESQSTTIGELSSKTRLLW